MRRIWLAMGVVLAAAFWGGFCRGSVAAEDTRIDRAMALFRSVQPGLHAEGIAILRTGGVRSLDAWHRQFTMGMLVAESPQDEFNFNAQVLAYLPEAEVNAYLLKEFRRNQPDMKKYSQLMARHTGNKPWTAEDEAEAARLAPVGTWWEWLIRARPALGFITSYDEAYALFMDPDFAFMTWGSSRALVRIDAARDAADFAKLLQNPDPAMQVRGLSGYEALERLPEADVWRRLVSEASADVLREVSSILYYAKRDQADLLIPLVAHADKGVREAASYGLDRLSWMTHRQVEELVDGLSKPEDRAAAWQKWWDSHKAAAEDDLREAGLKALIADVEGDAKWDSIYYNLVRFLDRPELLPGLVKRLASDNPNMRQSVASLIGRMEGKAQPAAVEAFLVYCRTVPAAEAAFQYYFLGRSKDPRAVDFLLKLMETEPEALGYYGGSYGPGAKTLGPEGDKKAAEIFYRWIVEKHNHIAAGYFATIPGARRYLPRLLDAWYKEPEEKSQSVLREAVERLGDSRLGPDLTRLLAETRPGSQQEKEVLGLMNQFPDAGAKALLLERLKTGHLQGHIQMARVLAHLGDFSGADVLLEDLKQGRPEDFPEGVWTVSVGTVLKEIGAPHARTGILALYEKSEAQDRGRILNALVALRDPANLEFFERLLGASDKRTAKTALQGMTEAILYAPQRHVPFERSMPGEYQNLVRSLILYERFDEPLQPTDGKFKHNTSLTSWDEAYIAVDFTQYFRFTAKDRAMKVVKTEPDSGPINLASISPQMEKDVAKLGHPVAQGNAFWSRYDKYLLLDVRVGEDRVDYIFKFDGRRWNPLCGDGGEERPPGQIPTAPHASSATPAHSGPRLS